MKIKNKKFDLATKGQIEFIDITDGIKDFVEKTDVVNGQITIFCPHTTASVVVNHNEPMLLHDFSRMLYKLAPIDERYNHDMFELTKKNTSDGRSNGHSHCKNILLGCSETLIVKNREIQLGQRQSIFFVELDGGRKRDYFVQIIGE